jgi:hypothetical protein
MEDMLMSHNRVNDFHSKEIKKSLAIKKGAAAANYQHPII